jgi:hypothetical protein
MVQGARERDDPLQWDPAERSLKPTHPQAAEGMRMDPPVSVPNEAIASARQCSYEPRVFGRIAQSCPEPVDGFVEAMIKVHKGVGGP